MDYRYKLPFDAARAERAYLEPPYELVDEEEENTLDLSGWDEHRIAASLYLQATTCLERLAGDINFTKASAKLYRKGEVKDFLSEYFKELNFFMSYATVCQDWLSHEEAGTLDELTDVEKEYWKVVFDSAWDTFRQWFDETEFDEEGAEIAPDDRMIFEYGIDIMSEGDGLLPRVIAEISNRELKVA